MNICLRSGFKTLLHKTLLFHRPVWLTRHVQMLHTQQPLHDANTGSSLKCAKLQSRSILRVAGEDAKDLLQGLMTNDVELLTENNPVIYTMFLNNQGRILYDAMCYRLDPGQCEGVCYLLECDSTTLQNLKTHLTIYKLRKKVDICVFEEAKPWAVFTDAKDALPQFLDCDRSKSVFVMDPRVSELGARLLVHESEDLGDLLKHTTIVDEVDYIRHRFTWGVSEGVSDHPPGDSLPLEANLAFMNGVSFSKGCYLGQELTARTYHTGVIRKRIMPINIVSTSLATHIEPGATVKNENGKNAGKFRGHVGEIGLALIRVALSQNKKLIVKDKSEQSIEMVAHIPEWWPNKDELLIQ